MSATARRGWLVALYLALLAPWLVHGALQTLQTNTNSPLEWVPPSFGPRADFDNFRRRFGSGDVLLLSWPACRVNAPVLDALRAELIESSRFRTANGAPYFDFVTSGRHQTRLLANQAGTPTPPAPTNGLRHHPLVGEDGQTTCFAIGFTPSGLQDRGHVIDLVKALVHLRAAVPYEDIHLAGPIMDGHGVDTAGQATLNVLALPSALVILVLTKWCLRSWRAAVIVFGTATMAQLTTLALVHYGGDTMSALLIVLPPLVQVLAVAGGLHLANYFVRASTDEPLQAAQTAWRQGWLPTVLSGSTTAIGLASLSVSQLTPIRAFARYGSLGVLAATALVLSAVPFLLAAMKLRPNSQENTGSESGSEPISNWIVSLHRYAPHLVLGTLLLMLVVGAGATRLHTSVRIETLFPSQSRILRDYAWFEQHIGPVVPIEVLLTWDTPPEDPHEWLSELTVSRDVADQLRQSGPIGDVASAASFVTPSTLAVGSSAPHVMTLARQALHEAGYLDEDANSRTWRVTAYVSALDPLDYGQVLSQVRERVQRQIARSCAPEHRPHVILTGTMPLVHEIQRQLLNSLLFSFVSALVLVTLVLTVVQASVLGGILLMVPNVFPITVLFGLLGWRNQPLDIGSVMTASIALGIAVDDTLHYIVAFRRHRAAGRSKQRAVQQAYRECAKAMMQTSIVCGLGMLVFSLSDFVPTQRFAWMMTALLALALAGDLLLLPAILLTPLERWMSPRPTRMEEPPTAVTAAAPPSTAAPGPHHEPRRPRRRFGTIR